MAKRSAALLLLISLFAASQSASLSSYQQNSLSPSSDSVCAQTCNQLYSQVYYQPGKTYTYNVDLLTRIGTSAVTGEIESYSGLPQSQQEVKISALADISVHGPCELVLKLRKVHLAGVRNHPRLTQQLEQEAIHFAYEDGKVVEICGSQSDDQWVVDVKKSIISALQMTSSDVSQKQTVTETDISGQCQTIYEPLKKDSDIAVIRKVKQMNTCNQRHQFNIAFFPRSYGLDQVLRSSLPFVQSNSTNECTQVLKNQIVESVTCEDRARVWPLNVQIFSRVKVDLVDKRPTLAVQRLTQAFRKHRLTMSPESMTFSSRRSSSLQDGRRYSVQDVQQLLRQINSHVQTSIQLDVPVLFSELIQSLHSLGPQEQAQIWEQIRSGELGSSHKLLDIFLDASALAGNEGSAEVLIRALQQQQISQQRANYLFGLLSFAKQPSVEAAQRLVQFVQQQGQSPQQLVQIPRGVLFGITGFVHNLQIVQQQSNQQNPNVDQVVQQISNLLVQGLQQLVQQISNQQQEHQALTVVYALRNLVLVQGQQQSQDQQIAQQLVQILQQIQLTQYNLEVRVAIVRTLVNAGINDQIRQYLVEQLIQNQQEGIEIQIEAYRAVVLSGATTAQLEQIRQYTDQVSGQPQQLELVNYIRSHQANLRTTSDPHKQTILPVNAPVFAKPSGQFLGISRNYELSYVNEGLNLGVTAETDIIYDQQQTNQFAPVPQTVSFNLTIPIGGSELQLVEVRLHQHGLEPVIARHLAKIQRSGERDPWSVAKETVEYIIQHGSEILSSNPQIHLLLQISVDGKTVVLIDEHDLVTGEIQSQSFIQELMAKLQASIQVDRAFAITPIDTVVQFPSVNGLPVQVRVNSSVVLGLRTELNFDVRDMSNSVVNFAIYPSVASQLETAVQFYTGPEQKVVEYIQSFYSAPQLNLLAEVTKGRVVSFKFNLPESRYTLARWESQVWTRNEHGQRVRWAQPSQSRQLQYQQQESGLYGQDIHVCTQSTQNPLGVQLCYDFSYSTPNGNGIDLVAEVYVVKTDPSLRTYELYFESPYSIEELFATRGRRWPLQQQQGQQQDQGLLEPFSQIAPFKFVFNTPGSSINREIVFELELPSTASDARVKEARLRIQTPWKRVLGQASIRSEPKERVASVEVSVDDEKFLQMELALETIRRGQKVEYRPRLSLSMDSILEAPVNLAGTLTYSQGRKSLLHFNLEDVQAKRQYIKGTFIRERGDRKSIASRTSADMLISLIGLNAKVGATFELADRMVKLDLASDYQLPSWAQKEQAKIAFKVQNLSSGKMLKVVNFGVVKVSQYPQYQIQYSQNVMYAAGEQFEHDLKLGWAADDEEQIRLYQAVKKTGQRGKIDIESQSIVVYRPQNINYEVKSTAALVGFAINGQKRYTILINGQSRDQTDSDSNFQAEFAYSHMSKSPLKMKMRAAIKSRAIDFIYSDEIDEPTPSNYHGHLLIQLTPEQQYSTDYIYTVKSDGQKRWQEGGFEEHELNFDLKDSRSARTYRHHGLLRMENARTWIVRSKLSNADSGDIYDGELKLDQGKTNLRFNQFPRDIRAKLQLDSIDSPTNGQFELFTPVVAHESQFEYSPAQSWQFISKTKRNDENLLSFEGKSDRRQRTQRFALNSQPFEGEWQSTLPEDAEQKAQLRLQMPNSWSHESSISRHPQKNWISLDSRTKYDQSNIADLSAKYDPEDEHYLRLNTPLAQTNLRAEVVRGSRALRKAELSLEAGQYAHQSKLSIEPRDDSFDFESVTRKSGQPLANLRYKLSGDNVHNIEIDSPQILKASAECNLARSTRKPFAQIDVKLTNQQVAHQTKLTGERQSADEDYSSLLGLGSISLESLTSKRNQNLAQIEANLSKQSNQKSFAKIRIGDHLESKIELEPYKSATVKVDCPHYDHLTQLTYEPAQDGLSRGDWKIQSSTTDLKNDNQRYSLDAEHQRGRRSAFKIAVPQFDSALAYEHPSADLSNHQMNFDFTGKSIQTPLRHSTQMRWLNQGKQNPVIRLDSQTYRQNARNGEQENILDISGAYHHNEPRVPSSFKVKLGRTLSGDLDVSMFNPNVKTVTLVGQLNDERNSGAVYKHQSEARFQPQLSRFSLDSNTQRDGQVLAKLDTVLTANPDEKSYLNLNTAFRRSPLKAQFELEPRNRRALLDLDMAPYLHRTEFSKQGGYQLKTQTTRDQQNVFDLDGYFHPTSSEQSHLKIKAGPSSEYQGEILIHPERRFGQISLRSNNLKHDSLFRMEDPLEQGQSRAAVFKTNTLYQDKLVANVDARFRGIQGENKIDAELPRFTMKTSVDVPSRLGSFQWRNRVSGRHLLGSIAVNPQVDTDRSFHFDFAWDVDQDPASKVQLDLSMKRIPSQSSSFLARSEALVVVVSAQYAQNKLVFNSDLVPEQVFVNPIRVSLAFIPIDQARLGDSWQWIYTHTMQDQSQYQCKLDFLVGQQLKYGLQLNGQVTEEKFQFGAQTQAPQKPQLQLQFNLAAGIRKPGEQYYLEASAVHAESNRYQVVFDLTKHLETRRLDGKLELRFPDMEVHVVSFIINLVEKQFQLDVVNEKTGKQVDIQASYADNLVHLSAVSNIAFFPAVDAKIRYIPGEELHAKLDLDQERKFELTAKYTGELSTLQFYALTKVDSVYTPSVEFVAEGRKSPEDGNTQRTIAVSGKYNLVEVLNGQFKQQNVQQWVADAQVSAIGTGEPLVQTQIKAIPVLGSDAQNYQILLTPRQNQYVQPFLANIQEQYPTSSNGYIRSIKIELTSQDGQQRIVSTEVLLKQHQWLHVPSMIEVSLEHIPSASHGSFRLSVREHVDPQQQQQQQSVQPSLFDTVEQTAGLVSSKRIVRSVRDQAVLSWNQKSAGFSVLTTEYQQNAIEHDLKLYSPVQGGRTVQIRCAHQFSPQLFFSKQAVWTNLAQQRSPVYQYTVLVATDPQTGYTGQVQLESYKFVRSPKIVEFTIQPSTVQKPLDVKLRFDVSESEKDAVTIKAVLQNRQSQNQISGIFGSQGQQQNQTLHFSAKSQDRSVLDLTVDAHVSQSSVGLVWQNLNRRGQQQQGQYLLRFVGENQFEVILSNPSQQYLVQGVYKRRQQSSSSQSSQSPLIIDLVVSKLVPKHQSWASKTAEPALVQEHKVHIETVDKCIRAEIEDTQSQVEAAVRQVNICVDMTRSSLVNIAVDSIQNGQKTAEFQARLDSRSVAQALRLSLHWNPQYSRQIIAALLQLNQQSQQALVEQLSQHELIQELVHKYTVIGQRVAQGFAYEPIEKILIDELIAIAQEFGLTQQVIQQYAQIIVEPVERILEQIAQFVQDNWQQVQGAAQEWSQQAQRACAQSQTCSRISRLVDTLQNSDDLAQLIAQPLVRLLQRSHRLVAHSQGKLIRNLPAIDWAQFVPQPIQQLIQSTTETVYDLARNLWFNPQNPFTGIWQHVEQVAQELTQTAQWREVRWERVQEALEQAVRLLVSPSVWTSSVRVLLWDPQNGQVQLEIQSPNVLGNLSSAATPLEIESNTTVNPFRAIFARAQQQQPSNISSGSPGYSWFSSSAPTSTPSPISQQYPSDRPRWSIPNDHVISQTTKRSRRSILELASSIINSGGSNESYDFHPKPLLFGSIASHLKLDLIWVEQLMAKNVSTIGNLAKFSQSANISCRLNAKSRRINNVKLLDRLNLLKITIRGDNDYGDANTTFVDVTLENSWKDSARLSIVIDKLKITINQNLVWALDNSGLMVNDSIAMVGQTVQLKLVRKFGRGNEIQMAISWTPGRNLISIQTHFNFDLSQLNSSHDLCSLLSSLHFEIESRDTAIDSNSELSFHSPEDSTWKAFSSLYHEETMENFASANEQNSTANETRKDLSCSRWMLLSHFNDVESEMDLCRRVKDGCNLAAYFVERQELNRVPNQCLACALPRVAATHTLERPIARFGSRRVVNMADQAQVVFVLDGSCHQQAQPQTTLRFMHQLNRLAKVVEKEFRAKRIITPDSEGKYRLNWPHFERRFNYSHILSRDPSLLNRTRTQNQFLSDPFMESTWASNGKNSFDFLHLFSYPPSRTSRHFVLIDCLVPPNVTTKHNETQQQQQKPVVTSCTENEIDFSTARTMFLHSHNFVHIISGLGISRRQTTSPKLRRVIGIDWSQAIFDNETVITTTNNRSSMDQMARLLRPHILPQRDICHVLALETNGSVFGHRVLKQANRRILARRMAENLSVGSGGGTGSTATGPGSRDQCYRCDCMLNKDRLSAHEECILCRDRIHTLRNPNKSRASPNLTQILDSIHIHDGSEQEWTLEDGDAAAKEENDDEVDE